MREPIHVHPKQESSAIVLSGKLHFLVDGKEQIIRPGEKITIPAGSPHCFWNEDDVEAHSIQHFSPALRIQQLKKITALEYKTFQLSYSATERFFKGLAFFPLDIEDD